MGPSKINNIKRKITLTWMKLNEFHSIYKVLLLLFINRVLIVA